MANLKMCPCCQRGFRDPVPATKGSRGLSFRRMLNQAANEAGVTNMELARRLDCTQSSVTQTLKRENLSERVFRDYVAALGFEIKLVKVRRTNGKQKKAKSTKKR